MTLQTRSLRSFGEEKETLIKGAVDTVTARYPDYARLVKEAFGSDKMQALRAASHGAVEQLTQRVGHDVG